jgi:hypothetical protein
MLEFRKGISVIIIIYILLCYVLWYYKPKIMFQNNKIKQFGVGPHKTLFNYQIVIIFIAIFLFYFFEIYWGKTNNYI